MMTPVPKPDLLGLIRGQRVRRPKSVLPVLDVLIDDDIAK